MKKFDSINVIPFIDIMLVLLAIVLMTASFIVQGSIAVNTPRSSTSQALEVKPEQSPKRITIDADGAWYLQDEKVSQSALAQEIARWSADSVVHLKIDRATAFEQFVLVGDLLRQQAIQQVHLLALPDPQSALPEASHAQ